uniref:C2H2-type domain-containing protein n=2 Tax=Caenorhabditis tropicalis TaxID=1561998 RepID=A0A1I7UJZ7_9PELO
MDEEEIDVVNYDANSSFTDVKHQFQCLSCQWIGRSERSLNAHNRHKHPPPETSEESPKRTRTGRQRKRVETLYEPDQMADRDVFQERVTTKQLLGGRKRPKTIVDSIDDSALRTDREASRLHDLGIIDEDTSLGDYVRRGVNYHMMSQELIDDDGAMVIDSEVVIGDDDEMDMDSEMSMKYNRKGKRRFPDKLPDRLTIGDVNGKYSCYIASCDWKGGYRSLRMDHMKAIHPDWKMPSRFILERISKDGVYLNPEEYKPPFACVVPGCNWRGNYRASRSTHMRKVHPKEHAEKKRGAPGYNSTGNYMCHFPMCTWRGWSRSTRSGHMKKAHPDWKPEDNRVTMQLSCFYCKNTFNSYDQLCNHIANHGGLGLHVDEIFEKREQFSDWLQRVEKVYSILFERNDLSNSSEDETDMPKNYILHCNCTGQKGMNLVSDARNYIYQKHNYLKRRAIHLVTRNKNDCSVHLEVREDTHYGPIHVKGSLEHTGHRFGTPLLRLSPMDRQLYTDVMEWKATSEFQFTAVDAMYKLNDYEGFQMDHYSAADPVELLSPLAANPIDSLRQMIEQSDPNCIFGADFGNIENGNISFGYMTEEMKKFYLAHGPKKAVTIDNMLVEFADREFSQYTVIVTDEANVPKCAIFYLTSDHDSGPAAIMQKLASLDPQGPREILADISEVWVDLCQTFFKEPPTALISEWHLMFFWASKIEELIDNEFDVYCLVAALRRFLRVEELHQMQAFVVELLETMYECGYDHAAEFFDVQLTDPDFVKRWSPLLRSSYTSHAHPTTSVAAKNLREMYLSNEDFERVDIWFGHVTKRIQDFNAVTITQTYTLRPLDPPRKFFYNQISTDENGVEEELGPPHHEDDYRVMYEEDLLTGEVVEEEIIGHEITEQMGNVEEDVEEEGEMEEVVEEMEVTLEDGEEVIYEEIEEQHEMVEVHHPHQDHIQLQNQRYEEAGPSSGQRPPGASDEQQRMMDTGRPLPPKIPPHRLHMYQRKDPGLATSVRAPPNRISIPIRSTRETTKAVIRSKRKRERFAQLRECPPEVMRAIAAHAISYDGRKKEQRPYMYAPSEARMATSTMPAIPTPDMKGFGAVPQKKLTPQQIAQVQQQRRLAKDQKWSRVRQGLEQQAEQTSSSSDVAHDESVPTYSEEPVYNPEDYAPESMVVHHEEVHQVLEPDDDQQPCTSASLYR